MGMRHRCREAAEAQKLGQVRSLHRGLRADWVAPLWEQKGWWPLPVLGLLAMLVVLGWGTALALLVVTGGGLLVALYVTPVTDPDGRLSLAVCDEGLVVVRGREVAATVRWKDVTVTLRWPALVRVHYEEPLQFHEVRHEGRYEIVGTSTAGKETVVKVGAVTWPRRLVRSVERNVVPVVLERTRRELATTGRATFGPVTLNHLGDLTITEEGRRTVVPGRRLDWDRSNRQAQRSITEVSATSGLPGFYPRCPGYR